MLGENGAPKTIKDANPPLVIEVPVLDKEADLETFLC